MNVVFWILAGLLLTWGLHKLWDLSSFVIAPEREPTVNFPEMFGLKYEKMSFLSQDGAQLQGWWIPAANSRSDKTIICCHGWATNKGDILPQTWYLVLEGFNLFYFDFRGCGESSSRGPCSLGYFESRDLEATITFVRQRFSAESKKIGIYGLSMGASTAFLAGCWDGTTDISAIACEAPFGSFREVMARYGKIHYRLPGFPLVSVICFLVKARSGFSDHHSVSPFAVAKNFRVGNFFLFYGDEDSLAPVDDGKKLFEMVSKNNGLRSKEFWVCPGSSHAECWDNHPDLYREKLTNFFKSSLQ